MIAPNLMIMQMPSETISKSIKDWNFSIDLVRFLLENADKFEWTVRGSGRVLRLDLNENVCLHIWNDDLVIPGVSVIHNHPWNLKSHVVIGDLFNTIYKETETKNSRSELYITDKINCGLSGGLLDKQRECYLEVSSFNHVYAGGSYTETYDEIHQTTPKKGTITIVYRDFVQDSIPDVFWKSGEIILDNPPKIATSEEVDSFVNLSLSLLYAYL